VTSVTNAGEERNEGTELSLSYLAVDDSGSVLSKLRAWMSYAFNNAQLYNYASDANNGVSTVPYSGNYAPRVPAILDAGGLDVASKTGVYLTSTYQFVGQVPVTFDNSTWMHSYGLLSGRVGFKTTTNHRWALDLFLAGDNLTNSTYYSFLFIGPHYADLAQAKDGGSGDGYIVPGNYRARYSASINLSYVIK